MVEPSLKKRTFHGVIWKIVETGGTQFIQLVVSIFLARLVMPNQFSAIAMLSIFLALARVFVDSGFSSALMRKPNRTQTDCCTVFYSNIIISVITYIILFFCAPLVADFYELPELIILLRVMALCIIIGAFSAVQKTLFTVEMNFKALAYYNMAALVISGCVGIYMAYKGFQVWALVAQSILNTTINTIFVWYKSTWRPSILFSTKSLKEFFKFGSKLLSSQLLNTFFNNIYGVVIGKIFARPDLAFYNRAQVLNNMTSTTPTYVIAGVSYPAFCKMQEDNDRLREGYRKMIIICSFIIFPLSLGIGGVSFPLINVLYTEAWIYAATLLQIIIFAGMWYPIHAINVNFLLVKGRSDIVLRIEVIKKVVAVLIMCITIPLGLEAMCAGGIVSSLISLFINTHYTGKFLGMGIMQQAKDFGPYLILSFVMFLGCKTCSTIMGNGIDSLVISILLGIIIYLGGAIIFKLKGLKLLLTLRK